MQQLSPTRLSFSPKGIANLQQEKLKTGSIGAVFHHEENESDRGRQRTIVTLKWLNIDALGQTVIE